MKEAHKTRRSQRRRRVEAAVPAACNFRSRVSIECTAVFVIDADQADAAVPGLFSPGGRLHLATARDGIAVTLVINPDQWPEQKEAKPHA